MTIYTSTTVEKRDTSYSPAPQVVIEDVPDLQFKKVSVVSDEVDAFLHNSDNTALLAHQVRQRKRRNVLCLLFLLGAVLMVALAVISGLKIYRTYYYVHHQEYRSWCGVTYMDEEDHYYEFQQDMQTDGRTYEQIEVPRIEDFRQATILHDFEHNYTAIIDREDYQCFILPLNRSQVQPPRDFWDLIMKIRSGYYLPDERMVRENYRVQEPALTDLTPYGQYIMATCSIMDSYTMEKITAPRVMTKRSACETFKFRFSNAKDVEMMSIMRCP